MTKKLFSIITVFVVLQLSLKQCFDTTFSDDDKQIYQDIYPAWSPDGKHIAYYHNSEDKKSKDGLYLIDTAGLNKELLVKGKSFECNWSPDGNQIAYSDGDNIFTFNIHEKNINDITKNELFLTMPVFSSDSQRLIFSKIEDNEYYRNWMLKVENYIYFVNTKIRQKLNVKGFGFEWSPTGNEIVYTVLIDSSTYDFGIKKYNLDTNTEILIYNELGAGGPLLKSWSQDGKKIAFEKRSVEEIWLMNSDGSDPHFLVNGMYPSFSPDSKKIVFSQFVGGSTFVLKTINIDGTEIKQITGLGLDVGD